MTRSRVQDDVQEALDRVAKLERMIHRMHRYGKITDVDVSDASKPRARMEIGLDDQGEPVKSPWVPYSSVAGTRSVHEPPTVGQQMMLIAPSGNHRNAMMVPMGHSTPVPSPSTDPAAHVDKMGATIETRKDGGWNMTVGNASIDIKDGNITLKVDKSTIEITKETLTLDSKKILLGKNANLQVITAGGPSNLVFALLNPDV